MAIDGLSNWNASDTVQIEESRWNSWVIKNLILSIIRRKFNKKDKPAKQWLKIMNTTGENITKNSKQKAAKTY